MAAPSKTEETRRYHATGSDGQAYTVVEYTTFVNVTTIHDSQFRWQAGGKTLQLLDGTHVNRLEQGKYEILRTRVTLTFDGP